MPGVGDPTTHLMPQQPIHRAVFPRASLCGEMLKLVPNPYQFMLDDVYIMGTSGIFNFIYLFIYFKCCLLFFMISQEGVFLGQNINDLKRFCEEVTSVDLLKSVLYYQHLAPTVPDTTDGFPFENRDPLIIEEDFPHIFFAGNQNRAEFSLTEFEEGRKTLLLSIPSFSKTRSVLLVNLKTLDVIEQSFDYENID